MPASSSGKRSPGLQFVDANVFLRFLTRDDPVKAERVKTLLERAQRSEITLLTSESVIAELVFVLSSPRLYNLSRGQVRAVLLPIVLLKGLSLPGREVFLRALDLYAETAMDFIDALVVARMEEKGVTEVYSYDEHLGRIEGIRRLEP
jgi:predicted nucleic acid-binding protein